MTDWLPSLNALRAFETVSRHLNYRQAADELRVTPAAVKQLVRKLEDALGRPMLEREGRGLTLTPTGAAASEKLSHAFGEIAETVQMMRLPDNRQRLIASVEPSFATAWLVPRLDQFRDKHPDIDVLIDSSLQIADLARGRADIAIRFGTPSSDNLIVHRLFDEELCSFCSPLLTVGANGLRELDDLRSATLIHWDLGEMDWAIATRKWTEWKSWLSRVGADHIPSEGGLRFNDYNLAVQAAIAGHGVVLGSLPVLQSLVDANLLITPFPEKVATDIGYDLVATEQALLRPEVRCFLDWILEEIS